MRLEARPSSDGRFAFSPTELTAPQHGAIVVEFDNRTSAPHTLVFLEPIDRRSGVIVDPGGHDRLAFTTPGPGTYRFVCTVHEDMAGVLIVR